MGSRIEIVDYRPGDAAAFKRINLYERRGFLHDAEILAEYGCGYERANVGMSFPL